MRDTSGPLEIPGCRRDSEGKSEVRDRGRESEGTTEKVNEERGGVGWGQGSKVSLLSSNSLWGKDRTGKSDVNGQTLKGTTYGTVLIRESRWSTEGSRGLSVDKDPIRPKRGP